METIIERIRKLLALAKSANEHEAAVAMQRAQEMLAKYNLDMNDVLQRGESVQFVCDNELVTESSNPWRRDLASNLARLFFCDYSFNFIKQSMPQRKTRKYLRLDRHSFYGLPHNVAVVKEMFKYLVDTVERLAREARKINREGASYEKSFRHGCATRLIERISERYWASKEGAQALIGRDGGNNLPALYDNSEAALNDWMTKKVGELEIAKNRGVIKSQKGELDGFRAGGGISLDTQVSDETAKHMIGGN